MDSQASFRFLSLEVVLDAMLEGNHGHPCSSPSKLDPLDSSDKGFSILSLRLLVEYPYIFQSCVLTVHNSAAMHSHKHLPYSHFRPHLSQLQPHHLYLHHLYLMILYYLSNHKRWPSSPGRRYRADK